MISVRNLNCGFQQQVLSDLNLTFETSQVCLLLGANGAGKTCLLETVAGAIAPLDGEICERSDDYRVRARQISYAPQTAIVANGLCVADYLSLVIPKNVARYDLLVQQLELTPLLQRPLNQLSGGEKQRARLASTLLQEAQLYILDEPTTSLDPRPIDALTSLIRSMAQEGKNFFIASHDLAFSLAVGTRFLGLKNGGVDFDVDATDLRERNLLDKLFDRHFSWHALSHDQWGVW